ncbi:MAG: FAD/NAD(P)-binding protein [Alphaproteobacteria bacterium]|nr:FAD/NAD(P)-binding protein [Alphaproteobacteria bacterium]
MNTVPSLRLAPMDNERSAGRRVAVIGAGFSGTMVAIHLHALLPPACQVLLCERDRFACGTAYATPFAHHMLNVRATGMSAFPADSSHFVNWLAARATDRAGEVMTTEAGAFASRRVFGDYLSELLETARATAGKRRIALRPGEVVDIERAGVGFRLHFADGGVERVGAVVLAMGNLPPPPSGMPGRLADAWSAGATTGLRPDLPVLIVGTGLTMIDLALQMRDAGFAAPIIALSRRGLLPRRHRPTTPWPTPVFTDRERRSLLALLDCVRREVRAAAARGVDWRCVIDSLRPMTADLWCGLPPRERARFLRHLRPFWDVHRHRLPGPIADRIDGMRAQGQLDIRRGRLLDMRAGESGVEVTARLHGASEPTRFVVQRVIDAMGLTGLHGSVDPLAVALMRRGLARADGLGLGLDVTSTLAVIDASGHAATQMWALGPVVRGALWECTAVPEIRVHAVRVAHAVAEAFAERRAPPVGRPRPQPRSAAPCAAWRARTI